MSEAVLRVLVGDAVRVAGSSVDPTQPGVSFATFGWPDGLQLEFASGNAEYAAAVAQSDGVQLNRQYSVLPLAAGVGLPNSVLRFGDLVEVDEKGHTERVSVAAWQASNTSVRAEFKAPDAFLANRFADFALVEAVGGLIMRPLNPAVKVQTESSLAPSMTVFYTGLGLLEIVERTAEQEWRVPSWPGEQVAGGELYVERNIPADAYEPAQSILLLVGASALTRIYLDMGVPESAALQAASDVNVDWLATL